MTISEAKDFVAALKVSYTEMDQLAQGINDNTLEALIRAQRHLARRLDRFIAGAPNLGDMGMQARLAWYGAESHRLSAFVRQSGFHNIVKGYLGEFDEMARLGELALRSGGVPEIWANVPKSFIKAVQNRDFHRFDFLGKEVTLKLDSTFMDMVIGGMNRADMLAKFRSLITGEYDWGMRKGLYEWHAGTYVRTATHRHMQSFMNHQAQEAGLENYLYLGPYDTKTRPFCAPLVGSVLSKKEIDELDNGQGGDVYSDGGGWNCRHQWMAVTEELAQTINDNPDELGKKDIREMEAKKLSGGKAAA